MEDDNNDHASVRSYKTVLRGLTHKPKNKQRRDPRALRLAAVTSAVVDLIDKEQEGGGGEHIEQNQQQVSASQVYAKAVTALEGTLTSVNSKEQQRPQDDDVERVVDTLATQVALLELLTVTLPYVQPAAILRATLPLTSCVFRALVASVQQVDSHEVLETKDELGGVNATLRGVCAAVAAYLVRLEPDTDHKAVQQLYSATLMQLWEDRRAKVRKAAQNASWQVLTESKHPVLRRVTSKYFHTTLVKVQQSLQPQTKTMLTQQDATSLLHMLALLERCIRLLDFETLSKDVMELLMCLFQLDAASAASDYVAMVKTHQSTEQQQQVLVIQSLLAIVVAAMEEEETGQSLETEINAWSCRVLASLLTGKPMLIFRSGDRDILERGRTLYGRAVIASLRRVMVSNIDMACKVLPLSIQMVLLLSKPNDDDSAMADGDNDSNNHQVSVSSVLLVELTQLFRGSQKEFQSAVISSKGLQEVQKCEMACLESLSALYRAEFQPCWSVGLKAIVVYLNFVIMNDSSNIQSGDGNDSLNSLMHSVKMSVETLLRQRTIVPPGSSLQKSVDDAFSTLVQGLGIEKTWSLITWRSTGVTSENKNDISVDRVWVLSTLKSAALTAQPEPPRLAFFQNTVLDMARAIDKVASTTKERTNFHRARVVDLWSLLQCFCKSPCDVADSLPSLSPILCKALEDKRYPQLVFVISRALTILSDFVSENDNPEDSEAMSLASQRLLPVVFKLISQSTPPTHSSSKSADAMSIDSTKAMSSQSEQTSDTGQQTRVLSEAIASLSRHAPPDFLRGLFKKLMHKLLDEVQSDSRNDEKICSFLSLSQALVASETLDEASISFLYRTLKPFIRSDESGARCQKRAYKVLAELCERNPSFFVDMERLKEMTELLTATVASSQVAARHMRLKCLKHIVDGMDKSQTECLAEIEKVLAETLLCLKDTNAKTREAAYQLLLAISARQQMESFLRSLAAALGAETPHMRSAAVMALSRIVFEFGWEDATIHNLLPQLLSTVLVLMSEQSREVIKSVVGFIRISVAAIQREQLEPMIPELIKGLLGYHKTKDRFRSKIKIILKKLVKQFGYETLMPHVPESETRLLTHMRKLDERQKRRKESLREERRMDQRAFDEMVESDEEDSDDGRTLATGATGFTKMTGRSGKMSKSTKADKSMATRTRKSLESTVGTTKKPAPVRLPDETDGEIVDMLGAGVEKRVKFVELDEGNSDVDSDSDGAMEFDDEGRLVVHDSDEKAEDSIKFDAAPEQANKKQRTSKFESAKILQDKKGRGGKSKKSKQLGAAYKSKKAGGDVKRKDQKFEPYAYVPLSGRSYSKKNRRNAVENMSSVVRQGKKRKQT